MEPIFTFTVLNPTDTTRTSGFDELFEEGVTLTAEGRLTTNFWCLPGHQLLGGSWSSQRLHRTGETRRTSSLASCRSNSRAVPGRCTGTLTNIFLSIPAIQSVAGESSAVRASPTTKQTRSIIAGAHGVGGNSMLRSRPADTFGIGYYYLRHKRRNRPDPGDALRTHRPRARRRVVLQHRSHALVPPDARSAGAFPSPRKCRYSNGSRPPRQNRLLRPASVTAAAAKLWMLRAASTGNSRRLSTAIRSCT